MGIKNLFGFLTVILKKYRDRKLIKCDEEKADERIDKHPWEFSMIKDDSKKTYEMCLEAVTFHGLLLRYVPVYMQTDEVIDIAIENSTLAFMWIKNEKKKTYDRCLEAVSCNGLMLDHVPEDLKYRVKEELGL